MFRFPGFYVQKRTVRQYTYNMAAHLLGDVAEASPADIEEDDYYQPGDYIGKLGIERSYEKALRGEKGIQILLRDAHGRVQGRYKNGELDHRASASMRSYSSWANGSWRVKLAVSSPSSPLRVKCSVWYHHPHMIPV